MLNCLCWVAYGAPAKNLPVVIINGVGFLVEGVYCALYIAYSGGKTRLIAIIFFISEFILAAIIATVLLTLLRGSDNADVRQMIFGVFASASGVVMYASPIMDLVNVVKTKDKSNMSLALALFSFGNGVVWTVYAFFKPLNWYIMIPNAVGIICASAQMVVYVLASLNMFCFKHAQ